MFKTAWFVLATSMEKKQNGYSFKVFIITYYIDSVTVHFNIYDKGKAQAW